MHRTYTFLYIIFQYTSCQCDVKFNNLWLYSAIKLSSKPKKYYQYNKVVYFRLYIVFYYFNLFFWLENNILFQNKNFWAQSTQFYLLDPYKWDSIFSMSQNFWPFLIIRSYFWWISKDISDTIISLRK